MKKKITIVEFLNEEEIAEVFKLKTAKEICEKVIRPNIHEINKRIGQENDPMYLAYLCEYVINKT